MMLQPTSTKLSIVVPVCNEALLVGRALRALQPLRARGHELIVADGDSDDDTPWLAQRWADRVLQTERGRANQMNAAAVVASGDILLFLHIDTGLPTTADALVQNAHARGALWGRFDVVIAGRSRWLPWIATCMNWRSRLSSIATGDQAIFVDRRLFFALGGYPDQPLMEDVELSRRLRRITHACCLRPAVVTSGRRWDERGVWRTIRLMWRLRWLYWRGVPARVLAEHYR